jgi:enamine deaminase RidA (YjgF/YER057c/UK114 family)
MRKPNLNVQGYTMDKENGRHTNRRSVLKALFASIMAAGAGAFSTAQAKTPGRANGDIRHIPDAKASQQQGPPLFSGAVVHNGLVYIAGKGYHEKGDIRVATDAVLKTVEAELVRAGSSMERVLKVNVYLHDLKDYAAMNEVYRGRFGSKPPVRTTVACVSGIPGNSLVEIDCIAALNDQ